MGLTECLACYITLFIEKTGYIGVTILMTLESMVAPVPSEAVMPFAGFLISDGKFNFQAVILFSTLGSIIGSLISYYIGYYLGKPFVKKFGKLLLLNEHHLDVTEHFFNKYGEITIFFSRFIPVVRHFISIPGGVGRMNIFKFLLFTVIGAGLWNSFLTYVGFVLRNHWERILKYAKYADLAIIVLIILGCLFLIYKYFIKPRIKK